MGQAKNKKVQVINGITVHGKKEKGIRYFKHDENASVNFTGPDKNNIGKIAVYICRKKAFGKVFDPDEDTIEDIVERGEILYEDNDSFVIGSKKDKCGTIIMKHPELYSFFRIVKSKQDVNAIIALVENYTFNLFDILGGEYPFDCDMLTNLENSVENNYISEVPVKHQEQVIAKLKQTKFKLFYG